MSEEKKLYGTVLIHAKDILDFILTTPTAPSLKDISEGVSISKSTVLKILTTLEFLNFVRRDEDTKNYYLGTAMVGYSEKAVKDLKISSIAKPILTQLRDETGETVHLGMEENHEIVFLDKIEGNQSVALSSRVGGNLPMYCSGMGKATLATKSEEQLLRYANNVPLEKRAINTITSKAALIEEIHKIQDQGYSIDDEENENDVICIAMPIRKHQHNYGAFSISAPAYRMTPDRLQELRGLIQNAKEKILAQL